MPARLARRVEESPPPDRLAAFTSELRAFCEFGRRTIVTKTLAPSASGASVTVPTFVNEFWTSKQRAAHSFHEVSYRACFKPQLPRFFISRLSDPGDLVYDPFMGRGTTVLEAALLGREAAGCDVNPLSAILTRPRLEPPTLGEVEARLGAIPLDDPGQMPRELGAFYHRRTLSEICALRRYLMERGGSLDAVDRWIAMVAVGRLTGHSAGFFSVYTLPPNQAVSARAQRKINRERGQRPPRRDVKALILRKSRSLLRRLESDEQRRLGAAARRATLLTGPAAATPALADGSVSLVITSPPFLDVVDYAGDNWLRCWFCGIDPRGVPVSHHRSLEDWKAMITEALAELRRVLRPGGHVAFEVGEVRGGKVRLEEAAIGCGAAAGLEPLLVVINDQAFTKTANCWGVENNRKGTNSNRIVVFRKE